MAAESLELLFQPGASIFSLRVNDEFLEALETHEPVLTLTFPQGPGDRGALVVRSGHGEQSFVFTEVKATSATDVSRLCRAEGRMDCLGQLTSKLSLHNTDSSKLATKPAPRPRARAVGAAVAAEGKQRPASPATTAAGAAGVTGGATAGAGTAGAELRPRVLHLLAIKPHTRTDLEQRLKIAQGDPALTALLNEIAQQSGRRAGAWDLKAELFREVQVYGWKQYGPADRSEVLRRVNAAFDELGLSADERRTLLQPPPPPTSAPQQQQQPSALSYEEYTRYRREYQDKYKQYSQLYEKLSQNQREFAKYQEERHKLEAAHGPNSPEVRAINDKIVALHAARKHEVVAWEKEFQQLHSTLANIKHMVKEYERAHAQDQS